MIRALRGEPTIAEKRGIQEWVLAKLGERLDDGIGSCLLRDPRAARIVAKAITHFDGERYELLTWCVMPNHVHGVFCRCTDVAAVVHSWKSFTSKQLNRLRGSSGKVWEDDYFDRAVRNPRELQRVIDYVQHNPTKGGLVDWPFVGVYPDRLANLL